MRILYKILLVLVPTFSFGLDCEEGEVDLGWGDCNLLLSSNENTGCMPSGCHSISETVSLNYSYVYLGEFSSEIGALTNLNYIHLSDCGIYGAIPVSIENLTDLIYLQIYDNGVSDNFPDSIGVQINSNLSGQIPLEIGNLTDLEYIARLICGELVMISHNAHTPPFSFWPLWTPSLVQDNIRLE